MKKENQKEKSARHKGHDESARGQKKGKRNVGSQDERRHEGNKKHHKR